jgi:hypothetical protein
MIKAQGGIFGWVSDSAEAVRVLNRIAPDAGRMVSGEAVAATSGN